MRQIVIPKSGEPDVMEVVERPAPIPGPGEVAIDVVYCGCNWADTMMRRNTYPHPVKYPVVPGLEVSGRISALGPSVSTLSIGDRVAAYLYKDGGYAETCVVPQRCVVPLPPAIELDVAAAFPVQALTAYFMLHMIGRVQAGWVVLIHAIGGGVGLCLTQLAAKAGAKVIGTVGSRQGAPSPGIRRQQGYQSKRRRFRRRSAGHDGRQGCGPVARFCWRFDP